MRYQHTRLVYWWYDSIESWVYTGWENSREVVSCLAMHGCNVSVSNKSWCIFHLGAFGGLSSLQRVATSCFKLFECPKSPSLAHWCFWLIYLNKLNLWQRFRDGAVGYAVNPKIVSKINNYKVYIFYLRLGRAKSVRFEVGIWFVGSIFFFHIKLTGRQADLKILLRALLWYQNRFEVRRGVYASYLVIF